jgi:hypothetical protein
MAQLEADTEGRTLSAAPGGQRIPWVWLLALAACVPALVFPHVMTGLAAQWELARAPDPFFLPAHAWTLWVAAPAVALSGFVFFLLPGLLAVRALRDPGDSGALLLLGFGTSILLLIGLGAATRLVTGASPGRVLLLGEWVAAIAAGLLLLAARRSPPSDAPDADATARARRRTLWLVLIVWIGAAALAPKIHWENFSLDGIEAYEFGRSLSSHGLPYWDIRAGAFGYYRNFVLFAWPNHFFLTLFGPVEAAARLPILLYLAIGAAGIVLLVEHGAARRLDARAEAALFLSIALFTVVQAFDTNYEPFFADLAETAATDVLWMACFLAAVWALWTGRTAWFWAFGFMNFTASPGGLFLLVALGATVLTLPAAERGRKLRAVAGLLVACAAFTLVHETFYRPAGLQGGPDQFASINMVKRLFPLTITEWARLNTLVFATGILPALALLFARRRDSLAWSVTGVTILYFVVVYIQAWAAVHQFTPAMVLPHIVFWRAWLRASPRIRTALVPVSMAATILCLVLSLPRHDRINTAIREAGLATDFRVADYDTAYREAARAAVAVYHLFPEEYRMDYPEQGWGTDSFAWLYYATRPKPAGTRIAYVVQDPALPAPPAGILAGRDSVAAVWVTDEVLWREQREPDLPRVVTSPLYEPVLRSTYRFFRERTLRLQEQQEGGDRS